LWGGPAGAGTWGGAMDDVGAGAESSARSWLLLRGGSSINGASESRCNHP